MTICFHYLVNKKVLVLRLRWYYQAGQGRRRVATLSRPLALDSMRHLSASPGLTRAGLFLLRCSN